MENKMRIIIKSAAGIMLALLIVPPLAGSVKRENGTIPAPVTGPGYVNITPADAKLLIESNQTEVVLDVRTLEEHNRLRIPNSILIPYDEIESSAFVMLPDKDALILVYCRSGRRSVIASEALAALGYGNVKNFGGIIDWPYETIAEPLILN